MITTSTVITLTGALTLIAVATILSVTWEFYVRRVNKQLRRIRLKQIAGNATTEEIDWATRISKRIGFRNRPDLEKYRYTPGERAHHAKTFIDKLEKCHADGDGEKKKEQSDRFQWTFKNFAQVDRELMLDKESAVDCVDTECGGQKTKLQIQNNTS